MSRLGWVRVTVGLGACHGGAGCVCCTWENMDTIVFSTILPLVRSVHVHSISTFFVEAEMREC